VRYQAALHTDRKSRQVYSISTTLQCKKTK